MKIAGLTWHGVDNFGSMLQAYALQCTVKKDGAKHIYVSYTKDRDYQYIIYYCYRYLRSWLPFFKERKDLFTRFHRKNIKSTLKLYSKADIHNINDRYDGFICGSDQIWAPNILDSTYLLDFVSDSAKKVAYAASIGLDNIPQNLVPLYEKNLKEFSSISVREKTGQRLLLERCHISADVVLDPTMLLTAIEWRKLENPLPIEHGFAFCYFLSESNDYLAREDISGLLAEMPVVGVTAQINPNNKMKNITDCVGPAEFLWLVDNAEYIITDSFHGAVFSLIFKKRFVLCSRFKAEDPVCQNSRIEQLSETMKLERFKRGDTVFVEDSTCYKEIDDIIAAERKKSCRFISESMNQIKSVRMVK